MTALPADTPCADLDERLRVWFQALLEAPVPERLVRCFDRLSETEPVLSNSD